MYRNYPSIRLAGLIIASTLLAVSVWALNGPVPSVLEPEDVGGAGVAVSQSASRILAAAVDEAWVDDNFNAGTAGWGVDHFAVIQDAVATINNGGTIHIANGLYTTGFNIDTKTTITLTGESRSGVIIKPTSSALPPLFGWNAEGYTTNRSAACRIFKSSGITIENLTVDMDNAKLSNIRTVGIFASECPGLMIDNCCVKNNDCPDASAWGNIYTETGIRVSTADSSVYTPPFTCSNRAPATIQNCLITDAGRMGIHGYGSVYLTILNCTITKDPARADFGYGIQLGQGGSGGYVYGCVLRGFGTAALSDGSSSGAYYFTCSYTPANCPPTITIENCQAYDSTAGIFLGNNVGGTTNVDFTVNMLNNLFENNVYGMSFDMTDATAGSSLTINAFGNTFRGSLQCNVYGSDYHYWIAPGNSNIAAHFENNNFENSNYGMYFEADDSADGSCTYYGSTPIACGAASSWDMNFNNNNFINNGIDFASNNNAPVNAANNWWGQPGAPGPGDIQGSHSGDVGTTTSLSSPQSDDVDGDGLKNWEEDKNMNGVVDPGETDPTKADTDGDTYDDGAEVKAGTDPLNPASFPTNPYANSTADTDGDGYMDLYEVAKGTDPTNPASHPTLGDANTSGFVDNLDAVIVYVASLGETNWDRWNFNDMDVNRDGIKNNLDAIIIMNFFLANIHILPTE